VTIVPSVRISDNRAPIWPREPARREAAVKINFAPGLHVPPGQAANVSAYHRWVGRWSRLLVPAVISAAEIAPGYRILDVSTGTGEAALMALPAVEGSGVVIGADIAPAMLIGARDRLKDPLFCPVAADGQALPFKSDTFDAVICQLGLQFFSDPARGLAEFHRVLRPGCCAALCVVSTPDRAPMWGVLADVLSRFVPEQRDLLYLVFALADANRLEHMLATAGFSDVRVERVQREDTIGSFDEYWDPIYAGMGTMSQVYIALPEIDRRAVREEVKSRLSPFESNGHLIMSIEMLIGIGRA
jgi:ubiquinone/menaquinone biosynthesis C-methylase UbiE